MHERVEGEEIIKHSFILFFTKVLTDKLEFRESEHGELKWFDLKEIENQKVIPSDLWLIKNKIDSEIDVKSAYMDENKGELNSFRFIE